MIGLRFFPLKSAEVSGAGTRDERLRGRLLQRASLGHEDLGYNSAAHR